jgi:hypothetical protein
MKRGEFISVAKRMVKEYINYYVMKGGTYITLKDISVIGFNDADGNLKCILYTRETPEDIYKVTYDKETDSVNSELIKRDGFRKFR